MATIEEQVKKLQAQKDANSAAWHTAATQADKIMKKIAAG